MMQVQVLADGRLHLNHGPIDLICQAWGSGRARAFDRAVARFDGLLEELVAELPALRAEEARLSGPVARAMQAAVQPFRPVFITPMAAVAGAVAEAALAAMVAGPGVERAYVNNGGDIAVHLTPGQRLSCAMAQGGMVELRAADVVRGIATSGWRGRSWSLGIADAVTVLARTAAMADAAATMIANAVDLPGHPAISRRPAVEMQADSDLGSRLVTVAVGALSPDEVALALHRGREAALAFQARGLIEGAALFLQGQVQVAGQMALTGREVAHV
jgi:ApbE superfamily uncharacterized protein (UPF0280 family)